MNYSKNEGRYQWQWDQLWERLITNRVDQAVGAGQDSVQSKLIIAAANINFFQYPEHLQNSTVDHYFYTIKNTLTDEISPAARAEIVDEGWDNEAYVRDPRIKDEIFSEAKIRQIQLDLQRIELHNLLGVKHEIWPVSYLWDEVMAIVEPPSHATENCFDRIINCAVEWCRHHTLLLPLDRNEVSDISIADIFDTRSSHFRLST